MKPQHATDLEMFVKETLVSIVRAVKTAQAETAGTGAKINPDHVIPQGRAQTSDAKGVEDVRFDVALIASRSRKGGAGLKFHIVSAGAERSRSDASISRIVFSIPVCWPQAKD
jgi:hypothetical protein